MSLHFHDAFLFVFFLENSQITRGLWSHFSGSGFVVPGGSWAWDQRPLALISLRLASYQHM